MLLKNVVVFIFLLSIMACNTQRRLEREAMKKQQEALEKQDARKAERMMEYEMAMQQHYDIQSKKTQKMMRKTYKQTERRSLGKKEPLPTRIAKSLFGDKRKTKKRKTSK